MFIVVDSLPVWPNTPWPEPPRVASLVSALAQTRCVKVHAGVNKLHDPGVELSDPVLAYLEHSRGFDSSLR